MSTEVKTEHLLDPFTGQPCLVAAHVAEAHRVRQFYRQPQLTVFCHHYTNGSWDQDVSSGELAKLGYYANRVLEQ